jgi:hypothetical protein
VTLDEAVQALREFFEARGTTAERAFAQWRANAMDHESFTASPEPMRRVLDVIDAALARPAEPGRLILRWSCGWCRGEWNDAESWRDHYGLTSLHPHFAPGDTQAPASESTLTCPKCRSTDVGTAWHRGQWASSRAPACDYMQQNDDGPALGEHLHRTCRGCRYRWRDPIAQEGRS